MQTYGKEDKGLTLDHSEQQIQIHTAFDRVNVDNPIVRYAATGRVSNRACDAANAVFDPPRSPCEEPRLKRRDASKDIVIGLSQAL